MVLKDVILAVSNLGGCDVKDVILAVSNMGGS